VNLVPATPSLGSPEPLAPPPKAPAAAKAAPPAPAPTPKAEEKAPPKAARPEPPPRPERAPERTVEPPPPRAAEVAAPRPKTLDPSELALPKRAEKESPVVPPAAPKAVERTLPPPPPVTPPIAAPTAPAAPTRLPEPPKIATPPAAPSAPAAPAAPPTVAAAKPGVEPIRLGRPNAPTTSTGSIAVDASDFPFTYYLRLIQSKIGERWSPPRAAATGGERVTVLFEIQRDGQVREPTVEKSSGNAIYDQSALRAVTEASPFPPLPPEFKASSLRIHFGFEFQPGQQG
jgi:TonB family protein